MRVSEGPDTFEFRSAHGMKAARSRLRTFADIAVRHLQHFNHPGRAWHDLSGPQDTLTVVLSEIGGRCEARTNLRSPAAPDRQRPNHISFVPAEMRIWGYTGNIESVRELRLSFDRKSLGDCLGPDLDEGKAGTPELMFHNRRAVECARLLAAECDASDPSAGLYGEGLMIALLSACFQGRSRKEKSGLSASQLRLVLDYIHENLDASVSLIELARLVGLSSSQFARLFKASTGVSPHRYQLNTRIGKAQELLLLKGEGLSIVAAATGFADQSHFTRAFKRVIGATPGEWRQDRTR
jgi:AraC family transcriptional regulator